MLKASSDASSYHFLAGRPGRDRKAHYRKPSEKGKPLRQSATFLPRLSVNHHSCRHPVQFVRRSRAKHQGLPYPPISASTSRSGPGSRRAHGPRGIVSVSASRLSFAIVSGPLCPKPFAQSKGDPQDAMSIARTTIQVRIWICAVDHGLRRNIQPAVRYPLNWLPKFDTSNLSTRPDRRRMPSASLRRKYFTNKHAPWFNHFRTPIGGGGVAAAKPLSGDKGGNARPPRRPGRLKNDRKARGCRC
jgi:hypothetical protein